ncbi:MAG: hypothetical protein ACMUHM_02795 [Thermoplasmatota archaeon]
MGAKHSERDGTPFGEWEEFKKAFRSIRFCFPHMLSHHPHCRWYEKDVLRIGRLKFCWGCIVTYPAMIAALAVILAFGLQDEFEWWQFVIAGGVFGSFEFISLWRKGRGIRHRTIKFFLGLGLAFMLVGIFSIPIHIALRVLLLIHLYLLASLFASLRIFAMEKKCKRCSWMGNWNRCPGFEEMNSRLEKEGLLIRK